MLRQMYMLDPRHRTRHTLHDVQIDGPMDDTRQLDASSQKQTISTKDPLDGCSKLIMQALLVTQDVRTLGERSLRQLLPPPQLG